MEKFGKPEDGAKRVEEVEAAVKLMEQEMGARHPKVALFMRSHVICRMHLDRMYNVVSQRFSESEK